jgi:diacylglycerol kinase (ATP)
LDYAAIILCKFFFAGGNMNKHTGIKRIVLAAGYSVTGLKATFRNESAFRQELFICALLSPLIIFLEHTSVERLLLTGSLLIVLITEVLNSALEAVVDRIGSEHHELSGRAKDMGSAAVFLSLAFALLCWVTLLWPL